MRPLVHPADALEDDVHRRGIERDALAAHLVGLDELELPVLPREEGIDDLEHLVLNGPPELARLEEAHLHENLSLPLLGRDLRDRAQVVGLADHAVPHQERAERVLGVARGGERNFPVLPVDGSRDAPAAKDELPRLLNRADEAQHVRKHQRLQVSPKNGLPHRIRLSLILTQPTTPGGAGQRPRRSGR